MWGKAVLNCYAYESNNVTCNRKSHRPQRKRWEIKRRTPTCRYTYQFTCDLAGGFPIRLTDPNSWMEHNNSMELSPRPAESPSQHFLLCSLTDLSSGMRHAQLSGSRCFLNRKAKRAGVQVRKDEESVEVCPVRTGETDLSTRVEATGLP